MAGILSDRIIHLHYTPLGSGSRDKGVFRARDEIAAPASGHPEARFFRAAGSQRRQAMRFLTAQKRRGSE